MWVLRNYFAWLPGWIPCTAILLVISGQNPSTNHGPWKNEYSSEFWRSQSAILLGCCVLGFSLFFNCRRHIWKREDPGDEVDLFLGIQLHSSLVWCCAYLFLGLVLLLFYSHFYFPLKILSFIFRNRLCKVFIFSGGYKACVSVKNISGVIKEVNRKIILITFE